MSTKEAIKNYLAWKAIRSPRAAVIYKPYLERFAVYKHGETKKITDQDVVKFNQLSLARYNAPTVSYSCRVLKNFFRYLNSVHESSVNEFLIQAPKYAKKPRVGVSDEEFKKMCSVLNPYNLYDLQVLAVLYMLHDTGMRVGELCSLNVDKISSTENFTSIETEKNKQTRWIMWSKDFHHNILLRWLGSRICINQYQGLFLAFSKNRGRRERATPRTIQRWVKETAQKAGITGRIHPHMFRHAKAHYMKANGADLKDIQLMLGHVTPFSALIYLNYDKNEMLSTAKKYL